jgi:hypothetical protein
MGRTQSREDGYQQEQAASSMGLSPVSSVAAGVGLFLPQLAFAQSGGEQQDQDDRQNHEDNEPQGMK